MIRVTERAMKGVEHLGGRTSFAPSALNEAWKMGSDGVALFANVSARVQAAVEAEFGTTIYYAGALLTRIWADPLIPDRRVDVAPGSHYTNPHVDKANRASYDYSALLYLNSHCSRTAVAGAANAACAQDDADDSFEGGRFAWLDESADLVVEPRGGRLLAFTGGLENPHQVRRVLAGTRYAIGFWFTCHREQRTEMFPGHSETEY